MKFEGSTLYHKHQSSILNEALDAGGKFPLAQDDVVAAWARLQMPSATETWRHVETATTFKRKFKINCILLRKYKASNTHCKCSHVPQAIIILIEENIPGGILFAAIQVQIMTQRYQTIHCYALDCAHGWKENSLGFQGFKFLSL